MIALSQVKHPQIHFNTHLAQAPGYYRIKVGDSQVTALSDGVFEVPIEQLFVDAKPGEVDSALKANAEYRPYIGSVNVFPTNTGSQLILVDTGAVDHFHPDHWGGLVRKGKVIFPNATIYLGKADVDLLFGQSAPKAGAKGQRKIHSQPCIY
jgi:glyoxylase-like metal-dependent hydrolase (beta-lactamase superfamily II)